MTGNIEDASWCVSREEVGVRLSELRTPADVINLQNVAICHSDRYAIVM